MPPSDPSVIRDNMPVTSPTASAPVDGVRFRSRPWQWATALCCLVYLLGLGAYPLLDPDEGRYAEIPREMIERGDFIIPTLNYVPYFEKPPLLYWITAGFMGVLGEAEWVIRLVPALLGLLGLVIAWWLARVTVGREVARWTPGVLGTTLLYFALARIPLTDMLFAVTLAATLTAWWSAERRSGSGRWWMLAGCGILLGLAVLSKGLVAIVLFGAITVASLAWQRRLGAFIGAVALPVVVGLATNAPWWLAAQARNPEFAHFYFVVQHLDRFLGHGLQEHRRPPGFFIPIVILGCGFWSVFWGQMLLGKLRAWRGLEPAQRAVRVFLGAWALVVVGFFSLSSSQLATYVLPAWWPLAVCTAAGVYGIMGRDPLHRGARWSLGVAAGLWGLLVVVAMLSEHHKPAVPAGEIGWPAAGITLAVVAVGVGFLNVHRLRGADARMGLLVSLAALVLASLLPVTAAISRSRDIGGLIPQQLRPVSRDSGWTIAQYLCYNQALTYYTHTRVVLIGSEGELTMGPQQPDAPEWFPRDEAAIARLTARGPLALVVRTESIRDVCAKYRLTLWNESFDRGILFNDTAVQWLTAHGATRPTVDPSFYD